MIVKLEDIKQDFNDWSTWRLQVKHGGRDEKTGGIINPLDAKVTDLMAVSHGGTPTTIVPVKYLDRSTERRVQVVEECFNRWPEAHQKAVSYKYLETGIGQETKRMELAAKAIKCSRATAYNLIEIAHYMVWQVYHFNRWDLT